MDFAQAMKMEISNPLHHHLCFMFDLLLVAGCCVQFENAIREYFLLLAGPYLSYLFFDGAVVAMFLLAVSCWLLVSVW